MKIFSLFVISSKPPKKFVVEKREEWCVGSRTNVLVQPDCS